MTAHIPFRHLITTLDQLSAVYGEPHGNAIAKESNRITDPYRVLIEAAPFFALASGGPEGLDCSPRGDPAGFVRVQDEHTLLIPDRRGNNRIDTLRNILHDPRVALLFLIPGCNETIRVMGRASISADPELAQSFLVEGKAPRTVIVLAVDSVFTNAPKPWCARSCGTPPAMSIANPCPAPARSWLTLPTESLAARNTIAKHPIG
jgi:PPOX class probable FMN-dependent enzyme